MSDNESYDDVFFAMQRALDEAGGPDRICNYCFHPRSSEFCRTSHPYPPGVGEGVAVVPAHHTDPAQGTIYVPLYNDGFYNDVTPESPTP